MKSTQPIRQRLLKMADAFVQCSEQATLYGKCVSEKQTVGKGDCASEFKQLSDCMKVAAKKRV